MKSFLAACVIFAVVIGLLIGHAVYVRHSLDTMIAAVQEMPQSAHGDPAEYGTAMQDVYIIWKKTRRILAVTAPRRATEPLERSLRGLEAGWMAGDDALYRQSIADLMGSLQNLREAEGFSPGAIV